MQFGDVKMNKYHWLSIAASYVVGFLIGIGIKTTYELNSTRPYTWDQTPVIINCYGEEFSEAQMFRAIHYWTIRGHEIGYYEHKPSKEVCNAGHIDGFIIVRKAKPNALSTNTLAATKRRTSFTWIRSAEILYSPGSYNLALLNEHELGHALGYSHLEIKGHIMHPIYEKMGLGILDI